MPRMTIKELNEKLSVISRVVIHPKYRGIGLGEKLIRETLPLVGTPYVEMIAVMPKYNPFAERAGMQRVFVKKSPTPAVRVASTLEKLGFDLCFLSSQRYVNSKLEDLTAISLKELKTAFKHNYHPMYQQSIRAISCHSNNLLEKYKKGIQEADFNKLYRLIKVTAVLLQSKVYLFWQRGSDTTKPKTDPNGGKVD